MQNHDRERQEEIEEAAELWRLQETSARHKNNRRGRESNSDYKTTWSPEQHPARRQQWEKWEESKGEKKKETEDTQTERTTAHSPLILQGCNSHTHRQPCYSQKRSPHCLDQLVFRSSVDRNSHLSEYNKSMEICEGKTEQFSAMRLSVIHLLHRCFTLKAFHQFKKTNHSFPGRLLMWNTCRKCWVNWCKCNINRRGDWINAALEIKKEQQSGEYDTTLQHRWTLLRDLFLL